MKVVVTNGYVTVGCALYAVGAEIDLPDGVAKSLLMEGVVSRPEMILQDAEPADLDTENEERDEEDSDTENEERDEEDSDTEESDLDPVELPVVDPAAVAKRSRGRKK